MTDDEIKKLLDRARERLVDVAKDINKAISLIPEIDDVQQHMFAAAAFSSLVAIELKAKIAEDMANYYDINEMNEEAKKLIEEVLHEREKAEQRNLQYFT